MDNHNKDHEDEHVLKEARSPAQYRNKLAAGYEKFSDLREDYLAEPLVEPLLSKELFQIHKALFGEVATWAGQKTENQLIFGGRTSTPPVNIDQELQLADIQVTEMWKKAESNEDKFCVLAFQHSRLIGIHPFHDGNGRSTRALMEVNIDKLTDPNELSKEAELESYDRDEYIASMKAALDENNIAPLTKVLLKVKGHHISIPDIISPDYNTWSKQATNNNTLAEDLALSKNAHNSYKNYDVTTQERKWLKPIAQNHKEIDSHEKMNLSSALQKIDDIYDHNKLKKLFSRQDKRTNDKLSILEPLTSKISVTNLIPIIQNLKSNDNDRALATIKNYSLSNNSNKMSYSTKVTSL